MAQLICAHITKDVVRGKYNDLRNCFECQIKQKIKSNQTLDICSNFLPSVHYILKMSQTPPLRYYITSTNFKH